MKIGSSKQMREWYIFMKNTYSPEEIKEAMQELKPDAQKVIELHYEHNLPLAEVAVRIQKSLSMVRNHQWAGIYKLHKYFKE